MAGLNDKTIIYPRIGFGQIRFGMYASDVVNIIGSPEQNEKKDEDGDNLYQYESQGIDLLCFEEEEGFKLTIIELNKKSNAYLWGADIFQLSREDIDILSKKRGYNLSKSDSSFQELPQELYQIEALSIDFYFEKKSGKLGNFSFGAV